MHYSRILSTELAVLTSVGLYQANGHLVVRKEEQPQSRGPWILAQSPTACEIVKTGEQIKSRKHSY